MHDVEIMRQVLAGEMDGDRAERALARAGATGPLAELARLVATAAAHEQRGDRHAAGVAAEDAVALVERLTDDATRGGAPSDAGAWEAAVRAYRDRLAAQRGEPVGFDARTGEVLSLWKEAVAAVDRLAGMTTAQAAELVDAAAALAARGARAAAAPGAGSAVGARRFAALASLVDAAAIHARLLAASQRWRPPAGARALLADAAAALDAAAAGDFPDLRSRVEAGRARQAALAEMTPVGPPTVFVVHGHDHVLKDAVKQFVIQLGCEGIVLHELPEAGRAIIEKFEAEAAPAAFAVALFTPDDEGAAAGAPAAARARQNVVFELGYFMGRLGRSRVAAIVSDEALEVPSDLAGIVPIVAADPDGADWRRRLRLEMAAAGLVDPA